MKKEETEEYRFTNGSLFKYDKSQDQYIHVLKQANCNTKAKAIREYENQCDHADQSMSQAEAGIF